MFFDNDLKLEGIGVENYKIFEKYQYFNLAPLTILTGTNNSGKSALASSLLLLSKSDIFSHLEFHNEGLDIGDISQVLNNQSDSKFLKFDLKFGNRCKSINHPIPSVLVNTFESLIVSLSYVQEGKIAVLNDLKLIIDNKTRLQVKDENHAGEGTGWSCFVDYCFYEKNYLQRLYDERLKQSKTTKDETGTKNSKSKKEKANELSFDALKSIMSKIPDSESFVENFEGGIINYDFNTNPELKILEDNIRLHLNKPYNFNYKRTSKGVKAFSKGCVFDVLEQYFKLSNLSYTVEDTFLSKDDLKSRFKDVINDSLKKYDDELTFADIIENLFSKPFITFFDLLKAEIFELLDAVKAELQGTRHVEAQRATKQRLYLYQEKSNPLTRDIIDIAESNRKEVNDFLKKWSGFGESGFKLFDDFKIVDIEGVGYKFQVLISGQWVELSDLGFGTRQVIPVIISIFNHITRQVRAKGTGYFNMLIIEEPESNLHPKLQSLLADLFIYAKNNGHRNNILILETHSEYLIRKIQYLVAKKEISNERVAIHYIGEKRASGSPDIFEIIVDPEGLFDRDFGKGFFDEATNWKFELLKLKNAQKN